MKRNAITRIIIWSIVIVVLLSVMFSVMFGINWRRGHVTTAELEIAATAVTAPSVRSEDYNAVVTDNVNVRSSPSLDASVAGMLETGDSIRITRQENISGQEWAFISSPMTGWVLAEYTVDVLPDETVYISDQDKKDIFSASEIQELEIEWAAGDILIQTGNTDQITVKEDNVSEEKYTMVLKQQGNELKIAFCEEGITNFIGLNDTSRLNKDLTITVPKDWICKSLNIATASAILEVNDLTIREVDFDGASGTCTFENCTVEELDIDTTSGDVRFIGSLNMLDCDAASASVYAVLTNIPSRLDLDMMSGDLDLTLPEDAGFTLRMDGLNGDFSSDFETTIKNGSQVSGDGSCRINVDALSGDVTIRKVR